MMLAALLLAGLAVQDRAPIFPSPDEAGDAALQPRRPCRLGEDTITVCGDPNGMRLPTLDEARYLPPIRPDFRLPGGGKGKVYSVQRVLPGDLRIPAAFVTATFRIGKDPNKPREDGDAK
jgi:hypothetical protein